MPVDKRPEEISFTFKPEVRGSHVHVDIIAGRFGQERALAGELRFRVEEWEAWDRWVLEAGGATRDKDAPFTPLTIITRPDEVVR